MKPLKIKYCKHIPFKGYLAITLFGYCIVREEYKETQPSKLTINHESIHAAQAGDFGIGFAGYFIFYLLYLLEWLFKIPASLFGYGAYRSISFEQEAFNNEHDLDYLETRKPFTWLKYIFKLK